MGIKFPAIAGSEGVGIVEKIGEGVTSINDKDTVMLIKPNHGKPRFGKIIHRNLGREHCCFGG